MASKKRRLPTIEEASGSIDFGTPIKPEPVLTRAEIQERLTDDVLWNIPRPEEEGLDAMRARLLATLFPAEGGR